VRAEAGIATNLVGMTKTSGKVSIRATAPGLQDAVAQFQSLPYSGYSFR
jgi:hypothetical protein